MAEGQKSADVKHILTPPPPSAKHEKWREGVWRPRKTHVFGVLVRQLAEGVRKNSGQNGELTLTVTPGDMSQWMGHILAPVQLLPTTGYCSLKGCQNRAQGNALETTATNHATP